MSELFDNLPSLGQMFKLIVFLILALIVFGLIIAIVKVLIPIAILVAIVAGGVYLFNRLQAQGAH